MPDKILDDSIHEVTTSLKFRGMSEVAGDVENVVFGTNFNTALKKFLAGAQRIVSKEYSGKYPFDRILTLTTGGKKYNRVVVDDYDKDTGDAIGHKSVWCFINKENGDVLKAASWKAPAKHARGNIFDKDNGLKFIGPYGPAYLR